VLKCVVLGTVSFQVVPGCEVEPRALRNSPDAELAASLEWEQVFATIAEHSRVEAQITGDAALAKAEEERMLLEAVNIVYQIDTDEDFAIELSFKLMLEEEDLKAAKIIQKEEDLKAAKIIQKEEDRKAAENRRRVALAAAAAAARRCRTCYDVRRCPTCRRPLPSGTLLTAI